MNTAMTNSDRKRERATVAPTVDIYENAEEILLIADVPGVSKENVNIELEKDRLTLAAKRTNRWPEGMQVKFAEYDYYRAFSVPKGIDVEKIHAELTNGVLTLHLPRLAATRPRKIEINS